MASSRRPWSASEPGRHDAPLGHEGGAGRRGPQLLPELGDLGVASEGPVAVGQHGVLLGGAAQVAEGLELDGGRLPPAEPVVGEPEQLPHRLGGGRGVGQGPQDLAGLLEPLPLEGAAGVAQALLGLLEAPAGHGLAEGGVGGRLGVVGGAAGGPSGLPAPGPTAPCAPRRAPRPRRSTARAPRARGPPGVAARNAFDASPAGVAHAAGALAGDPAPAGLLELVGVGLPPLPRRPLARAIAAAGRARPGGRSPLPATRAGRPATAGRGGGGLGMGPANLRRKRRRTPIAGGPSHVRARRRPTLPGPLDPSTIGAGGLNFRVRNGNGWDPSAMATEICCQVERSRWRRSSLGTP